MQQDKRRACRNWNRSYSNGKPHGCVLGKICSYTCKSFESRHKRNKNAIIIKDKNGRPTLPDKCRYCGAKKRDGKLYHYKGCPLWIKRTESKKKCLEIDLRNYNRKHR